MGRSRVEAFGGSHGSDETFRVEPEDVNKVSRSCLSSPVCCGSAGSVTEMCWGDGSGTERCGSAGRCEDRWGPFGRVERKVVSKVYFRVDVSPNPGKGECTWGVRVSWAE